MIDPASLLRIRQDDEYRRQAAAESEFWGQVRPGTLEDLDGTQAEGPIDRYVNRRFTGDDHVKWYETIARGGLFRRGAVLGTSSIALEADILTRIPSLHLTFFDISEGALKRREEVLGRRFPGRVATSIGDLNFIELIPESYDVIVSSSTIHHVTNLEFLGWQVNRALVPGGYFFLEDYVGEPRFQFAPAKREIYRHVFNRDRARQGMPPSDLVWLDSNDLSPFCGVRSDEILEVFRRYLDEINVRLAGALTVPILRSRPQQDAPDSPWVSNRWKRRASPWRWASAYLHKLLTGRFPSQQALLTPEFQHELELLGDVLAETGILKPGVAFATYRKRRTGV